MKRIIFLISLLFVFSCATDRMYRKEDRGLYYQGLKAAQLGDSHSSFMYFQQFLRGNPKSRMAAGALFAVGEYYFSIAAYSDTIITFRNFVKSYPESKAKLFALIYLLESARKTEQETIAKDLEKEIVTSKTLSLLFTDYREYTYKSILSKKYKATHFIDRMEIIINEEFFTEILY